MNLKHFPVGVMEIEAVERSDLGLELMRAQPLLVQENQASEEVLQHCNFYGMCECGKYVHLDFKIVLSSLGAGRDMQILEDNSFEQWGSPRTSLINSNDGKAKKNEFRVKTMDTADVDKGRGLKFKLVFCP